ncbi:MAG TPA: iron-containing alcohol dehydrogenase [Acidimicrobiia bacterium]|nr:iron-containing alcohol dehydrogenase [Acidimicrobiia bacterium]
MNRFVYEVLGGRVVFGAGAVSEVPAEFDTLGARKVMIIASGSSIHLADFLSDQLGDGFAARIDQVNPPLPIEDVERARSLVVASSSQAVVTIGGGSTIGLGKNIAIRAPIQHLAIPTTYSGSEMTSIHGVTVGGLKTTGRDPRAKPQTVVYDPDRSRALPMRVTAGSAMNAAAHCLEALYAEQRNPVKVMADIAGVLGVADPAAGLFEMAVAAGAPSSLTELGMYEHDLDRAADIVFENPGYNPRPVERGWIRQLLDDAFLGKRPMTGH